MLKGNMLIAHGGGPTPVINSSLLGAVREAKKHPEIETVYGARFGAEGILAGDLIDLGVVPDEQLDLLYRRMNSMIHRVKPERTDLDMIYEIMLKLGVPLTYSVTPFSINNKTVYGVGDDCLLLVCLAEDVQPEDVEQMTEYAPAKIIISRDSFADDTAMANAYYILRDHGIELKLV